jgi:hypothetical protein
METMGGEPFGTAAARRSGFDPESGVLKEQ